MEHEAIFDFQDSTICWRCDAYIWLDHHQMDIIGEKNIGFQV